MTPLPDTRYSLILRLPTVEDAAAWREFVGIYEPVVYRFARRRGLQDADARELVQNVLVRVARAVGGWKPDQRRGRFRTWLLCIARNQLVDVFRARQRREVAAGGTSMLARLSSHADRPGTLDEELNLENQRVQFRWAAARVRESVQERTWQAFWLTSVQERPVEAVARELGLTPGAVYIARSRVIARLRQEVQQLEAENDL